MWADDCSIECWKHGAAFSVETGVPSCLPAIKAVPTYDVVVEGEGLFLLEGEELPMKTGDLLVAPDGVPHGVRNNSGGRLLVMAVLAPAP